MTTTVAVKVWRMGSDAGYVPSYGEQEVHLVPAEAIRGDACKNSRALYDVAVEFPVILQGEIGEREPLHWKGGACNYIGITGTYEIGNGLVAVQTTHTSICTDDEAYYSAKILNEKSLLAMYRKRAQRYDTLAKELEVQ